MGNRTYSTEWDAPTTTTYDLAGQSTTMAYGSTLTTYTYDLNGNLVGIAGFEPPNGTVAITTTMTYDKENRLQVLDHNGAKTTYTYVGNGQKRSENVSGALTTIVWDGTDYLQERT